MLGKLQYMAGFVPGDDSKAQKRCYEYLVEAQTQMERKIDSMDDVWVEPGAPTGEDPKSMLKNQHRVIKETTDLVSNAEGRRGWRYAKKFWTYWDKVKVSAIKFLEDDDVNVDNKIAELEEGRYEPN